MSLANWRDLAVVLLAIEAFLMSLIPGVILFFVIKGLLWLQRRLRQYAPTVQGYFRKASTVAATVSTKVAAPLIAAEAGAVQVRATQRAAGSMLKLRRGV